MGDPSTAPTLQAPHGPIVHPHKHAGSNTTNTPPHEPDGSCILHRCVRGRQTEHLRQHLHSLGSNPPTLSSPQSSPPSYPITSTTLTSTTLTSTSTSTTSSSTAPTILNPSPSPRNAPAGAPLRISVDEEDCDGLTPLHLAAWSGQIDCVRILLSAGASLFLEDHTGMSALHRASLMGHHAVCELLLTGHTTHDSLHPDLHTRHAADANLSAIASPRHALDLLSATTQDSDTPLHFAAAKGHESAVRLFIRILYTLAQPQKTPIYHPMARVQRQDPILSILSMQNADGDTPLHLAVHNSHLPVVKILLMAAPTTLAISNSAGLNPLQSASQKMKEFIISLSKAKSDGNQSRAPVSKAVVPPTDIDSLKKSQPQSQSQPNFQFQSLLHHHHQDDTPLQNKPSTMTSSDNVATPLQSSPKQNPASQRKPSVKRSRFRSHKRAESDSALSSTHTTTIQPTISSIASPETSAIPSSVPNSRNPPMSNTSAKIGPSPSSTSSSLSSSTSTTRASRWRRHYLDNTNTKVQSISPASSPPRLHTLQTAGDHHHSPSSASPSQATKAPLVSTTLPNPISNMTQLPGASPRIVHHTSPQPHAPVISHRSPRQITPPSRSFRPASAPKLRPQQAHTTMSAESVARDTTPASVLHPTQIPLPDTTLASHAHDSPTSPTIRLPAMFADVFSPSHSSRFISPTLHNRPTIASTLYSTDHPPTAHNPNTLLNAHTDIVGAAPVGLGVSINYDTSLAYDRSNPLSRALDMHLSDHQGGPSSPHDEPIYPSHRLADYNKPDAHSTTFKQTFSQAQ
eukprot:TRINITY_DN199_c1_g1_i1.p1 TRINITY_DN199_c1_g1~~TRINITY_DN199_c1_g1_i1.p1  ORF type:complete len:799 (+),score=150.49 TRINITY_DN199_c1_g1_i1:39-2435(+)